MTAASSLFGVWPAVLSPFDERLEIDTTRLARHCRALLAAGCRGLSLFGTTGEGTALSVEERRASLDAVVLAGVAADRIMPATGCCDVPSSAALAIHAAEHGAACVLALPPFYLRDVGADGIYRHFAATIERVAAGRNGRVPCFCLYNFPFHTGITLSPALVRRLADGFPGIVTGIKDSSGDWTLSSAYLEALPDLDVFVGDERTLLAALRRGGAGTISGMANAIAQSVVELCDKPGQGEAVQGAISAAAEAVLAHSFVPAMKAALAEHRQDPGWRRVRPPLEEAPPGLGRTVLGQIRAAGVSLLPNN